MKNIISFIKKYWVLLMIALAVVLYVVNLLIKNPNPENPNPTSIPTSQTASYNNVFPGSSTEEDLYKILGTPLRVNQTDLGQTDEYKSTSELRRHIATIQNGKVVFFKEIVSANDKKTAKDIVNIYGIAPNTLYNNTDNSTFNLYVYPKNGIAYVGHEDGTLLEVWYFQPTTIDNFITNWAQGYSTVKQINNNVQ